MDHVAPKAAWPRFPFFLRSDPVSERIITRLLRPSNMIEETKGENYNDT